MTDFTGVKIAIVSENKLVMILRDNIPSLRFAGMWDFPGGGREGNETPEQCAIREIKEELSINLSEKDIVFEKEVEAMHDPNLKAFFMVAKITQESVKKIELGNEGQKWDLISIFELRNSFNTPIIP